MNRHMFGVRQGIFLCATVALSWLLMQAVHEPGHVLHAAVSGGTIAKVILHPLAISRTDLSVNPHPLFVVWGGPVWGCLIPLAVAFAAKLRKLSFAPLFRFFAGFCLIANGVYLGAAIASPVGDATDLLSYRVPVWALVLFGVATVPAGLAAWKGLGPYFGFGPARGTVDRRAAVGVVVALVALVLVELLYSAAR